MVYRSAPGKRVPAGSIASSRIAISDTAGLASQVVHVTVPSSSTTTLSIDRGPKGGCGWPAGRSLISFCTIAMASPGLKTMPARSNSAIVVDYTIPSADCQSRASARRLELRAWRAKMQSKRRFSCIPDADGRCIFHRNVRICDAGNVRCEEWRKWADRRRRGLGGAPVNAIPRAQAFCESPRRLAVS